MPRYLLDTNVLVYGLDGADPAKRDRALEVVAHLGRPGADGPRALLPAQVLAEFARVTTARLRPPLSPDEAAGQVALYARAFPVAPLTPRVALDALRGVRDHGFSYFDAQIWAVARRHGVSVVLSEDFASGATVEGVAFVDPFAEAFAVAGL